MHLLRNIKMRLIRFILPLTIASVMSSCGYFHTSSDSSQEAPMAEEPAPTEYSDLRMFELRGNVKAVECTTYYNVKAQGNTFDVDTSATARRTVSLYFDELGNYVPSQHELVKRDSLGRLTYWRDRRPNAGKVDPGVLRDTLSYVHENDFVLRTSGMGETAVTVYDNHNRIVGQYSKPDVDGVTMSAYNIYTNTDDRGNWTERTTVWVTNAPGKRPHVSYTAESRTIEYYK